MAQAPSSTGQGNQPFAQPPAEQGGTPLSHMVRAEEAAGPPPRGGRWQRFLNRLGMGRRSRSTGHMTAQELFNAQQQMYAQQVAQQQQFAASQPQVVQPQNPPGQYSQPQLSPAGPPHPAAPSAPAAPVAPAAPAAPAAGANAGSQEPSVASAPTELVTGTLAGLAMRDLALVDSLIEVVEELEDTSEDPELLEKLFKIDNLATRMRRNGENLLVLAGQDTGDPSTEPVPLLDVARAAISEISEYQRVQIGHLPDLFISGSAADDISHLLAELMDNATEKSPEHAQVVVSAQSMSGERLLITVEDEGIGIPKQQLDSLNARLRGEPVLDEQVMRHMGLYVVSRIAHRHGIQVQLEGRAFRGVSAHVVVPASLFSNTGPRQVAAPPVARLASRETVTTTALRETARPAPAPSAPVSQQQEKSSTMDSSVTAAGLPRRSAHKNTVPPPMAPPGAEDNTAPPEGEGATEKGQAGSTTRAERIRADLEGFMEGQREAAADE